MVMSMACVRMMKASIFILLLTGVMAVTADQVTHIYDSQNRLIRTEYSDGNAIEYTYDAAGNRIGQKAIQGKPTLTVERKGDGSGTVKGTGIDCGSDCSESYAKGTAVSLTATAATGSVFGGWSQACSGTGTCSLTMDGSKKVVATFNIAPANPFPLTVTKSAYGVVSSSPEGILCGGPNKQCRGNFSAVTLTATPNSGYYFKKWVGCPAPTDNTCSLTLNKKTLVNAVFAKLPKYALKIVKTKNGVITSDPAGLKCKAAAKTCNFSFVSGTVVTLNPIPQPGYSFSGWDGACSGMGTCQITMDGKKLVGARFE
jgi:YD repeat-containing protein